MFELIMGIIIMLDGAYRIYSGMFYSKERIMKKEAMGKSISNEFKYVKLHRILYVIYGILFVILGILLFYYRFKALDICLYSLIAINFSLYIITNAIGEKYIIKA